LKTTYKKITEDTYNTDYNKSGTGAVDLITQKDLRKWNLKGLGIWCGPLLQD
jgi:hypothetical protein